jgi:predicted molibdopterin-dependent oxidoreductase YjgC
MKEQGMSEAGSKSPQLTHPASSIYPVPVGNPPVAPAESPRRPVKVTIDGREVAIPEGSTLLEATHAAGIETPTLCFLETLKPVNACRICVVEVEGSRTLVPACSRKAEDGMVVRTNTERVRLSRRLVLEFLASSVDVSTAPSIQSLMEKYDARPERFGPTQPPSSTRDAARPGVHSLTDGAQAAAVAQPVKIDNELYVRDYSKCILCYKCVEACGNDAQNTFAIAVAGRGFDARISTEFVVPLPESACVYCGNCIGVCPTGALMFKSEHDMRQAGTWDEARQTSTDTICPYCGVGCTLTLRIQDDKIVKVDSPIDSSVTRGNLCIKGRFGWQFVQIRESARGKGDSQA